MERAPRRTARLARQFHESAVLARANSQETAVVPIDQRAFENGIADLFAGQTLSPQEVASLLKCSVKSVHRNFQHMPGVVPVGKRSYLIPRSLFESWLRERMSRVA